MNRPFGLLLGSLVAVCALCQPAAAQFSEFGKPEQTLGPQLDTVQVQKLQVGMVITASGGVACKGLVGTAPVPLEWPEQQVRLELEDLSPLIKGVSYRMVGPTVKQMVVDIPVIPPGQECRATVTFEVKRYSLKPPEDTARFVLPNVKKLKPEMRVFLAPSPYIESNHATIRALAKELLADQKDLTAWERVETLYDGARSRVEYVNGPLKGAVQALKDGTGDCEELSSLFIALCRASDVPARIVWVPSHCYPEFYLEDEKGNGYWFPCEAAGSRIFGGIMNHLPILQKGDNFQAPERPRERQRYVAEYLTGQGGKPQVKFLREILAAD